jgi:tRNA G26 N,N-dimethylase Trm1
LDSLNVKPIEQSSAKKNSRFAYNSALKFNRNKTISAINRCKIKKIKTKRSINGAIIRNSDIRKKCGLECENLILNSSNTEASIGIEQ